MRWWPRTIYLQYHRVRPGLVLAGNWIPPRLFRRHLRLLCEAGLAGRVVLTFDDGFSEILDHAAPLIREMGFRAIVFPVAGYLGQLSSWDIHLGTPGRHLTGPQLRELAREGWEVGSHGLTHRDLRLLSDRELRRELEDSKKIIEDAVGMPVRSLSYPFGRQNQRVMAAAQRAGYERAFTRRITARMESKNPYAIPRMGVYIIDWNFYKLDGMWVWPGYWLERFITLWAGLSGRIRGGGGGI